MTETNLLIVIALAAAYTAVLAVWEWGREYAARKAQERDARAQDMRLRRERQKRELIAHNREQLSLEYLNREENVA